MASINIIGSRFSKILVTKNYDFKGDVSVDTRLSITSIQLFKNEKDTIKTDYDFFVSFSDLGKIEISGSVFFSSDQKTIKEILKNWDQKKTSSEDILSITNIIMQKVSIKAFELEEELGLPIHLKLPSLSLKKD